MPGVGVVIPPCIVYVCVAKQTPGAMADPNDDFSDDFLERVEQTLKDSFDPVGLTDVNGEDLYTTKDLSENLKSRFGIIPPFLLEKILSKLDFKNHHIGGGFFWLMRSKTSL